MIPYRDDNPTTSTAWVTYLLILVNAAVFLRMVFGPGFEAELCRWGAIPARLTGSHPDPNMPRLCFGPFAPARYTVVTHMFLHGGWLHIGGNMLYLWIFGNNIEDALGHFRYLLFYFLCGFTALFFQVLSNPASTLPMVGASGAIAGVLGAYLILFPTATVSVLIPIFIFLTTVRVPAVLMLAFWFVLQVVSSILSAHFHAEGGVAFYAHIGGFTAGVLLILWFPKRKGFVRLRPRRR